MNNHPEIYHAIFDFKNPYSLLAYRIIALHGLFLELCIFVVVFISVFLIVILLFSCWYEINKKNTFIDLHTRNCKLVMHGVSFLKFIIVEEV